MPPNIVAARDSYRAVVMAYFGYNERTVAAFMDHEARLYAQVGTSEQTMYTFLRISRAIMPRVVRRMRENY